MKKRLSLVSSVILSAVLIISAPNWQAKAATPWSSIPKTSDWLAMPGNQVNGTAKPSSISVDSNGMTITYTGGEYTPGGSNAGVMYANPIDLKNFSMEFTVTKKAGDYNLQNTGVDSWISLCLLNKSDAYFNVNKAGQSQGIVTLIRPMADITSFEIYQLTNSWSTASRRAYPFPGKMTTTFSVQIKKNSSGIYEYSVNGQKVDMTLDSGSDFTSSFTTLMEKGSVYFYMGVSSKDSSQQIEWKINKINGNTVKASDSATTSRAETTNGQHSGTTSTTPASTTSSKSSNVTNANGQTNVQSQTSDTSVSSDSSSFSSNTDSSDVSDSSLSVKTTESSSLAAGDNSDGKKSNTGLIVGIVMIIFLLSGGGFACYWFILRKKA